MSTCSKQLRETCAPPASAPGWPGCTRPPDRSAPSRNSFGQSSGPCSVSSLSRPVMVRSSNAAAASAVSSGTIASHGSLGSSTGIRFTPIAAQLVERGLLVAAVVLAPRPAGLHLGVRVFALLLLFGGLVRRSLPSASAACSGSNSLFKYPMRSCLPVQPSDSNRSSPIAAEMILAIRPVNRLQHQRAILHRTADRPQLVHRPAQRHRARARHQAKARPQARSSRSASKATRSTPAFPTQSRTPRTPRPPRSPSPPTIRSIPAPDSTDCASARQTTCRPSPARPA